MNKFQKSLDRIKKSLPLHEDSWTDEDKEHIVTIMEALEISSKCTSCNECKYYPNCGYFKRDGRVAYNCSYFSEKKEGAEKMNIKQEKRKEAIYLGFCSHDCEAHYKCPICNKNFGSWSLPREKQAKRCCPWCNTELDGLE